MSWAGRESGEAISLDFDRLKKSNFTWHEGIRIEGKEGVCHFHIHQTKQEKREWNWVDPEANAMQSTFASKGDKTDVKTLAHHPGIYSLNMAWSHLEDLVFGDRYFSRVYT